MQNLNKKRILQQRRQSLLLIDNTGVGGSGDHQFQAFSSSTIINNDKQSLEERLLLTSSSSSKRLNEQEKEQQQYTNNDFDLPLARSSLIFYNSQSFNEQQLLNKKPTKYEITPEYIANLTNQQSNRREKVLWANNQRTSIKNSKQDEIFELTNTSSELFDDSKDMSRLNRQSNKIVVNEKDFDEDYNSYVENGYVDLQEKREDLSQTPENILSSDDEVQFISMSNGKLVSNQAVQVQTDDNKQRKKKKVTRTKTRYTSNKRQTSAVDQLNQSTKRIPTAQRQTLLLPSQLLNGSGGDMIKLSAMKMARDAASNDESNTKRLICVDTSKARSNLDVVR
ncbi:unnamed protein product, partial [Didymodactylos carnosus]